MILKKKTPSHWGGAFFNREQGQGTCTLEIMTSFFFFFNGQAYKVHTNKGNGIVHVKGKKKRN